MVCMKLVIDLLLGDHLTEKSDTIKWVDACTPHKRSRRLKNYKALQELAIPTQSEHL